MKAKEKEVHMRWFCVGGLYEVDGNGVLGGTKETLSNQSERLEGISFTGVYDPEVLRKMGKWEREGMTWVNWGDEDRANKGLYLQFANGEGQFHE